MSNTENQSLDANEQELSAPFSTLSMFKDPRLAAGLYVVATPIGNLRDITIRALEILASVDVILCEDSRVSKKLLSRYEIKTRCEAYHDHSDEQKRRSILERIEKGMRFALISDAGMPMISDPGYKLARDMHDAGLYITSVPGASASLAALQLSAMPSDAFAFLGFLPTKTQARCKVLERWAAQDCSVIVYESARRLQACLGDIVAVMGADCRVAVAREITKKFEEIVIDRAASLQDRYARDGAPKGEVVLVIDASDHSDAWNEDALIAALSSALEGNSTKAAAGIVAEKSGVSRKVLYDMALDLKGA